MREIIKKGNNSPELEATSAIKLNSSSTSSYNNTDSSREDCNLSSNIDDGSTSELGCYSTANVMVVKQEAGLDIKPDPDSAMAASPSVMNGDDSLKNNLFTKQGYDCKVKMELVNGNMDTDTKPTMSDTGLNTATSNSLNSSNPPNTSPLTNENCPLVGDGSGPTKNSSAGVSTTDAQYMQQQSQIFVFTTQLANKAAEEMSLGGCSNIIQFHCSQPATRKLLEKHPLKMNQFSKANPPQWMNNMNMKGPKSSTMKPHIGPSPINETGQITPMACMAQNEQITPMPMNPMGPIQPGGPMMGPGPHMGGMNMQGPRGMIMHPGGMPNPMSGGPPMMQGSMNPRMQGGRSSDEDLTCEQRKHREEQQLKIQNLASWLLPELEGNQSQNNAQSNTPNAPNCMPNNGIAATSTQRNNNRSPCSVPSQVPPCSTDTPSNSLPQQPSNPLAGGPTPNPCSIGPSCSMQGPCTGGPIQGSCTGPNPTSGPSSIPDSCSNTMLSSSGPMSVGPAGECSNSAMIGNCGMPMAGSCSAPMPGNCSTPMSGPNVITSPVSLQPNPCGGPNPCPQTSNAPCPMPGTRNSSPGNAMPHNQPPSSNCSQNMNIGPSPVSMGPSPGLRHSPNMGPSPVMMGPGGMGMVGGMMVPYGPMGPQQNMMMGQGPMGNAMMGPSQQVMMGNGMGPGMSQMRMMGGPGNSMMMSSQMDWQRSMAEQHELKRKKNQMSHDGPGPMGMMVPGHHMGGPMMVGHMMGGPMHGNMGMMPGGMRSMGPVPVNRIQGPPPPYHGPGPRSMGNGPVPSPGSPSMCPITSPRMPNNCAPNAMRLPGPGSGMDSPRPSCSNPPTPVSSGSIASPSLSLKDQPTPQSVANDMPFGRQLQNFAQHKQPPHMVPSCAQQQMSHMPSNGGPSQGQEPSLMPVPSPQQIQYLNTFDGQELTIQKQPNTSLRETDILSPLGGTLDGSTDNLSLGNKASGPTTPQAEPSTPHTPLTDAGRYNNGPQTPDRYPVPSPGMAPPSTPHTPQQNGASQEISKPTNTRYGGRSPQSHAAQQNVGNCGPKTPSVDSRFPVPSPKTPGGMCGGPNTPIGDPSNQRYQGVSPLHSGGSMNDLNAIGKFPPSNCPTPTSQKISGGFSPDKISSLEIGAEFANQPTSNLPLDPSVQPGMNNPIPGKALDPISSMAQMSQQLVSSGQPGSPPMSSGSTPTLPTGAMPIVGPGPPGPSNMIDNQAVMLGIPPVSSSPAMMCGPVPSPVSGAPQGSSPGNMSMMPGNQPMMPGNQPMMPANQAMMPGNPRMMVPGMNPGPRQTVSNMGINSQQFNNANVQVKPNAPSTMHYTPARMQSNSPGGPRGAPGMEFITRFNSPTGMEKPVSPMFSNNNPPNNMCGPNVPMSNMSMNVPCTVMGGPMCPTGPMNASVPMGSMPGQMPPNVSVGNMSQMSGPSGPFPMNGPSGHVSGPNVAMGMGANGPMSAMGGPMGPNGHMMGPMGPNGPMVMNPAMMSNGPMGPNGQMIAQRGMSHMMRGPNPANMMGPMGNEMYAMNGPPVGMPGGQMGGGPAPGAGHPGQNQMMQGSAPMFASKGSPVMSMGSPMGSAPDTAQPLPPSMGQSGNYKNSHFMVPTTADPNYAVQFHNFQQQLYATNTRVGPTMVPMGVVPGGPHGPVGPGMPGPPHMGHQFPFNPK